MVIRTVLSQIPQLKHLWQHRRFKLFKENFQITKMPTKHKHPALSIEDKITIYECLDKRSSKREIACEYFYQFHVYRLIIQREHCTHDVHVDL